MTSSTEFPLTGRPPVTSRAQILEAARRIIDRDGWDRFTLRRLAADLKIGPTTLYRHVGDKQDLLVLLLNEHTASTARPDLPSEPRERIVVAAIAMHDTLADWPWAAEVLTTDGFVGLLDESALWLVETIVAGAVDHGCSHARAVEVFRSIWYFTVGEILVRVRTAQDRDRRDHPAELARYDEFDPAVLPHLAEIGPEWPELVARDIYPRALRALVEGLLAD